MMSKDNIPSSEEQENSPFRTDDAPAVNVSGIPDDYVMIDLSSMGHAEQTAKPIPVRADAESNPEPFAAVYAETQKQPEPSEEAQKADDSEQPVEALLAAEPAPKNETAAATMEIIGIRFKKGGKVYYFDPHGIKGTKGDCAIVETARGQEFGEVALENTFVSESDIVPPIRPVIRIATKADYEHFEDNRGKEQEAFRICLEKIEAHKLDMKLVEAQYTFDNSKLLFYFTSAGRVDFRDLVKDLASVFRTRIELRQIGIRDEAKLIGGLGSCGRALCCSGFLSDFGQVSIKMAKEQNLSLNSTKISGTCGRLMCCLRYEYETYLEESRLTPPVDSVVKTPDGVGTVVENAPLLGTVKVRLTAEPDAPPRSYHRDAVTVFPRGKGPTEEDLAIRARPQDDLADKLAVLETAQTSTEIPARRAPAEQLARKEKADTPTFRKKDESRHPPRAHRRNTEGTPRHKGQGDEETTTQKNRAHQSQARGKVQNHARRPHTGQKTQHRGAGGKGGSGNGNS